MTKVLQCCKYLVSDLDAHQSFKPIQMMRSILIRQMYQMSSTGIIKNDVNVNQADS